MPTIIIHKYNPHEGHLGPIEYSCCAYVEDLEGMGPGEGPSVAIPLHSVRDPRTCMYSDQPLEKTVMRLLRRSARNWEGKYL